MYLFLKCSMILSIKTMPIIIIICYSLPTDLGKNAVKFLTTKVIIILLLKAQ